MERSHTQSLCPVCMKRLPAQRVAVDGEIRLVKTCPEHGDFSATIWRGPPAFEHWQRPKVPVRPPGIFTDTERGCPFDCGLCPDHRQRSCTVIIEVTQRCDLSCPVCYAGAPSRVPDPSLDAIAHKFAKAKEAGTQSNIQLSGGEPTIRDDLPEIVALGRRTGFQFIQVNTNGLRLGRDREFVRALKQAGLASVFLQFDGTTDSIYRELRAQPLVEAKNAAVAACAQNGIGVVLVPTLVPGVNTQNIGDMLRAGLSWAPTVRGIHFQPISYFGRYPGNPNVVQRFTLPEIMQAIEEQSGGMFQTDHFGPPGCENALCSFNGYFMLQPDGTVIPLKPSGGQGCCTTPVQADVGAERAISFVARQWSGREPVTVDLPVTGKGCACASAGVEPREAGDPAPMSLDTFLQRARTHTFSVSAMAFQDAWNLALDRVRDCCIHVMSPDGRLIPFCLYNLTAADGRRLYRP